MADANSQPDFPAAHSMDSAWWAVDRRGHVAQITTGEAGGMPIRCANDHEHDLVGRLAELNYAGLPFYCDDLFGEADGQIYLRDWRTPWNEVGSAKLPLGREEVWSTGYLLWMKDEEALERLQAQVQEISRSDVLVRQPSRWRGTQPPHPRLTRLPTACKVVCWLWLDDEMEHPLLAMVRSLAASGNVLRAFQYGRDLELQRFGFYSYGLDSFDNWICGPCERDEPPPRPVSINALPREIVEAITTCKLDADFERDVLLQPFEHAESYCWGGTWVSTVGEEALRDGENPRAVGGTAQSISGVTGETMLTGLLAAVLQGDAGAIGVLNDYLEDRCLPALRDAPTPGARLDEMLVTFFTPEELLALEADFVEHAPPALPTGCTAEQAAEEAHAISQAVAAVRAFVAGQAADEQRISANNAALRIWRSFDDVTDDEHVAPRLFRRAWAALALGKRWPLVAARTCRTLGPDELAWQATHVLRKLAERYK